MLHGQMLSMRIAHRHPHLPVVAALVELDFTALTYASTINCIIVCDMRAIVTQITQNNKLTTKQKRSNINKCLVTT